MCGEGSDEEAESAHVVDRAIMGVGVLFEVLLVTIEEHVAELGNRHTRTLREDQVLARLRLGRRQDHEPIIPARRQNGVDSIPVQLA
jgi:hypothetical protein